MEKRLEIIVNAIESKKGEEIKVIKLNSENSLFEYIVLANGSTKKNIQTIADEIEDKLEEVNISKLRKEGYQEADWLILDYSDLLIHIFSKDLRKYYDLEELYRGAEVVYSKE